MALTVIGRLNYIAHVRFPDSGTVHECDGQTDGQKDITKGSCGKNN